MERLTIIGTSHIAKESVDEITNKIAQGKHNIIALELDIQRAQGLLQKQKSKASISDILRIGVKGYIFVKLGQYAQQKLGKSVGVMPGAEMKAGLLEAKKHKLQIALVDQPIQITLRNLSNAITWREKGRFISDIFKGIFSPKKQLAEMGFDKFDLNKVPSQELILKMMGHMKKRYPSIYKTLVEDRNVYMVKQLVKLLRKYPDKNILCVIGAGHKEGMEKLLLKTDIIG
jgi:pheromone shutdown-related protein TraB